MICRKILVLALAALLCHGSALADEGCSLTFKPETSGFILNPILKKVVVTKVSPSTSGQACKLMADDEILQVNDQAVAGQRAKTVMTYWKALAKDSPRIFKVRRAGAILVLTLR